MGLRAPVLVAAALICAAGPTRAQDAGTDGATPDAGAGAAEVRIVSEGGAINLQAKPSFQHAGSLAATSPTVALPLGWSLSFFGVVELTYLDDSTQSFGNDPALAPNNLTLQRPGTIRGQFGERTFSGRRSSIGLSLTGPVTERTRARLVLATTGFGNDDAIPLGHLYIGFETPIIDVLVGRTYSLFGWGGKGFAPTTAAYRSVFGQIYDLSPQVRVSHIFRRRLIDVEVAGAAVAAPTGVSTPQWQAGLRVAFNRWRGAAAQGVGPAEIAPVQIALSALGRRLQSGYWDGSLPSERQAPLFGHGLALDLLVPIVPAGRHGLRNALTLTFERSVGTGIADLYPGLGDGFSPGIPQDPIDPSRAFLFAPDPPGTVGVNALAVSSTIDWRAWVIGAHYHLPIGNGDRLWVSAVHSRLTSSNIVSLTPGPGRGGIWSHGMYTDATLFGRIVSALHASLALQVTKQTFGDHTEAQNRRAQVALYYFF